MEPKRSLMSLEEPPQLTARKPHESIVTLIHYGLF
jgi:hypothetical protein